MSGDNIPHTVVTPAQLAVARLLVSTVAENTAQLGVLALLTAAPYAAAAEANIGLLAEMLQEMLDSRQKQTTRVSSFSGGQFHYHRRGPGPDPDAGTTKVLSVDPIRAVIAG